MNVAAKPEPGIETNGELNPVASAFASIVLPVPGGPKKRTPRSRLPPWRSNCSPDCQMRRPGGPPPWPRPARGRRRASRPTAASPGSNVLICVRFIARSGPNRIPKLAMKRKKTKTTWIHRAGDERMFPIPSRMKPIVPNHEPPLEEPDDGDHDDEEHGDLEPEAPEPRATAPDDVLLAQRSALDAEEARRGDEPPEEEVGEAAEDDDDRHRREEGLPPDHPALLGEPDVERGRGDDRDDGRRACQAAPVRGELLRTRTAAAPGSGASTVAIAEVYAGASRISCWHSVKRPLVGEASTRC